MAETDAPAVNLRKAARDLNQIQRRLMWAGFEDETMVVVALKTRVLEAAEALEKGVSPDTVRAVVKLDPVAREYLSKRGDYPGKMNQWLLSQWGLTDGGWRAWCEAMMEKKAETA